MDTAWKNRRTTAHAPVRLLFVASSSAAALTAGQARAASLSGPVANYTTANVPASVSMYEYVPTKLAPNPPVLVVSHYCGGTAAGMFGIAEGGGLVSAADQYGFVMVFPQTSQGCWDISSTKTLTHDGGGDSQAIAEMVRYEIAKRGANANRVYATGQSSGAMMTEVLLAVYPDVFKGGAEFSGVPAGGCWTCSGGYVDHTPQQWGAIVDAMDPGYSGFRPRVQLWHGNADMTVNYENQLEAIKEWTDVLGLAETPDSTQMLTFNGHSWTREQWRNPCGFVVLDAFTEQGGPHNTDASEDATYVVPFLGLDVTGPVDPELVACDGGASFDAGGSATDAAARASDAETATDGRASDSHDASGGDAADSAVRTGNGEPEAGSIRSTSSASASAQGSSGATGADASGAPEGADASSGGSQAPASNTPATNAGCGCAVPRSESSPPRGAWAVGLLALALGWRRRRTPAR